MTSTWRVNPSRNSASSRSAGDLGDMTDTRVWNHSGLMAAAPPQTHHHNPSSSTQPRSWSATTAPCRCRVGGQDRWSAGTASGWIQRLRPTSHPSNSTPRQAVGAPVAHAVWVFELGQDLLGGLGPGKRLAVLVPGLAEPVDRSDKVLDAGEVAAAKGLTVHDREEDLDQVQPRR